MLAANSILSNIVNYCQDSTSLLRLLNSWLLYYVDISFCHQQTGAVCFSVFLFGPKNIFMYVCHTGSKIKILCWEVVNSEALLPFKCSCKGRQHAI